MGWRTERGKWVVITTADDRTSATGVNYCKSVSAAIQTAAVPPSPAVLRHDMVPFSIHALEPLGTSWRREWPLIHVVHYSNKRLSDDIFVNVPIIFFISYSSVSNFSQIPRQSVPSQLLHTTSSHNRARKSDSVQFRPRCSFDSTHTVSLFTTG